MNPENNTPAETPVPPADMGPPTGPAFDLAPPLEEGAAAPEAPNPFLMNEQEQAEAAARQEASGQSETIGQMWSAELGQQPTNASVEATEAAPVAQPEAESATEVVADPGIVTAPAEAPVDAPAPLISEPPISEEAKERARAAVAASREPIMVDPAAAAAASNRIIQGGREVQAAFEAERAKFEAQEEQKRQPMQ